MADVTLGDLLHWQRGLTFLPARGEAHEHGLEMPISWAVTIRTTPPVLPSLRGGEIVIAPPRLLARLRESDAGEPAGLVRALAEQSIAALMVDPEFSEQPLEGVRLLVSSGTFPHDAEGVLNRLLTERRAELYRMGSELSRAISAATISGAGLDALLNAAGAITGRALLLIDGDGSPIAASNGVDRIPAPPVDALQAILRTADAERGHVPTPIGSEWLVQPLSLSRARRTRRGALLAIEAPAGASHEAERLVLAQTAGAVELMLDQVSRAQRLTSERTNREALVADLLLGRLVSREAADARARLLSIDPLRPTRVVLIASDEPSLPARVRGIVPHDRHIAGTALGEHEYALILAEPTRFAANWRDLVSAVRSLRAHDPSLLLVTSEEIHAVAAAAGALDQARAYARLARAGGIAGPVVDAGDLAAAGVFGLLYPLWSGRHDLPRGRERLASFAAALLGPLEDHDRQRGSDLVRTLDVYLQTGGALADAAERLDVHRNTLSYRLNRVEALTGRDLADARVRLLLQLAIAVRALQAALSVEQAPDARVEVV